MDPFVDRAGEMAALEQFWSSGRAQLIPVTGRRRIGKTYLIEQFAAAKRCVYYRCTLTGSDGQLPRLGAALAALTADPVLLAQPPSSWEAVLALVEQLAASGRLLLVLDELPYWVARDESVFSIIQNWWDERGRRLDLMLVVCGSAVQMMERLFTGEAPLAGCRTGQVTVRPFDFRSAADLLRFTSPTDNLIAYGILGGSPLYLTFFKPSRSIRQNVLEAIASPTARLYVEPAALFAAHHESYDPQLAMRILRAMAGGNRSWSDLAQAAEISTSNLGSPLERLMGDLGLVERVLPVTETKSTRAYRTQYRLTDNFLRFWFRFVEPNQGHIEFGDRANVVDGIMRALPDYLGAPMKAVGRDWLRLASAAGSLPTRVGRIGSWWAPHHEVDVVGLDDGGRVAVVGESKWRTAAFDWAQLEQHLDHVRAMGDLVRPDVYHVLISRSGFTDRVRAWAAGRARLLEPADLFEPLAAA